MKNVTITLPDELAATVRVDAAKAGKSMSRYIADLLDQRGDLHARQMAAIESFLALPKAPMSDENGMLPGREENYRREVFRGHEHSAVHAGPERPDEGDGRDRGRS
ncbi:ribbon-helix-helix protein, CopG family [Methylopila sp. 73B]|uniref:ribbon-helix-helix protein, CopG family n=1 Tax=Methylopila sp. 73B TaxID=1120792 RepID=UPI00037AAEA1|nr:ribbon-helix-helix protein, CopG family [Methylopila sp. 73B]